jgi:hypothetical protein
MVDGDGHFATPPEGSFLKEARRILSYRRKLSSAPMLARLERFLRRQLRA